MELSPKAVDGDAAIKAACLGWNHQVSPVWPTRPGRIRHMSSSSFQLHLATTPVVSATLEQIAREGARRYLQKAIEDEVAAYVDVHRDALDAAGHRLVVRNGHRPPHIHLPKSKCPTAPSHSTCRGALAVPAAPAPPVGPGGVHVRSDPAKPVRPRRCDRPARRRGIIAG
jgi:hypothetical protein